MREMKESEGTEEITTFPLYPYLLQGQHALPNCKPISVRHPGDKSYRTPCLTQSPLYVKKERKLEIYKTDGINWQTNWHAKIFFFYVHMDFICLYVCLYTFWFLIMYIFVKESKHQTEVKINIINNAGINFHADVILTIVWLLTLLLKCETNLSKHIITS